MNGLRSLRRAAVLAIASLGLSVVASCGTASDPGERSEPGRGESDAGSAADAEAGTSDTSTDVEADGASDATTGDVTTADGGLTDSGSRDVGTANDAGDDNDSGSTVVDTGPDDTSPTDAGPPECGDLSPCGILCVDLATDPTNCGACGATCIVPNATAACVEGACAVGACDPGFFDRDGQLANGCEVEYACIPDVPCATECGGESTVVCEAGVAVCPVSAEVCNGLDDDCDGACDEGPLPGCRQGIHRGSGRGHVYSDDLAFVQRSPYRLESAKYFYLYSEAATTLRPVFLCNKGDGLRFLTTSTDCEIGRAPERTIGFWSPSPTCGAVPLYRMYQASSNNHFYTISAPERDRARDELGYLEEGVAGYVWRSP